MAIYPYRNLAEISEGALSLVDYMRGAWMAPRRALMQQNCTPSCHQGSKKKSITEGK